MLEKPNNGWNQIWLMVWNMFFPYIGNNHPNWLSYFLKGLKPPTRLAFIWVNYNDLTVLPHWNQMVNKVNHPQMAQQFRLVKPYTLPRFIMQIHLVLPPSPFTCWTLLLPSHVSWFKKHGVPYIFSETNPRTAPNISSCPLFKLFFGKIRPHWITMKNHCKIATTPVSRMIFRPI